MYIRQSQIMKGGMKKMIMIMIMMGIMVSVSKVVEVEGALTPKTFMTLNANIYNDPNILGTVWADIYYEYLDARPGYMRFDYPMYHREYLHFEQRVKYIVCPGESCEAETIYNDDMPQFFFVPGDDAADTITYKGTTCDGYYKRGHTELVYVDDDGFPCRYIFATGRTIDFNMPQLLPASTWKQIDPAWNCPQKVCFSKIDLILVFDESSSIPEVVFYDDELSFAAAVVEGMQFGPDYVMSGMVMFADRARTVVDMTYNKQNMLNTIQYGIVKGVGLTCISCGIASAIDNELRYGRTGDDVQRVMVILTDGVNNMPPGNFQEYLEGNKSFAETELNFTIITIGVGPDIDGDELEYIATDVSGVTTAIMVPDFQQLNRTVQRIIDLTCIDMPGNPCGQECNGLCSCDGDCVCPHDCDDNSVCTIDDCEEDIFGSGCTHTPISCDDAGDLCTEDLCDSQLGCYWEAVDCDDGNPCTLDKCQSNVGCIVLLNTCDDDDSCTDDSCDLVLGCQHEPIVPCIECVGVLCPPIDCMQYECDELDGRCYAVGPVNCSVPNKCVDSYCSAEDNSTCIFGSLDCNDGSPCTIDTCDPEVGCKHAPACFDDNLCTADECDQFTGLCNFRDVSHLCIDSNPCSDDYCDPFLGCSHDPVVCEVIPPIGAEDPDYCYVSYCNASGIGCYTVHMIIYKPNEVDECGECGTDDQFCVLGLTGGAVVGAGIGAGILVVLIVGGLGFLAVSMYGAKKGYDAYMKFRNVKMDRAVENPLYNQSTREKINPAFRQA